MDNQFALAAQVHALQAALATSLLHPSNRTTLPVTFRQYMKLSKQSTPQLADRMEALEAAVIALLGAGFARGVQRWRYALEVRAGSTALEQLDTPLRQR